MLLELDGMLAVFFAINLFVQWIILGNSSTFYLFISTITILIGLTLLLFFIFITDLNSLVSFLFTVFLLLCIFILAIQLQNQIFLKL